MLAIVGWVFPEAVYHLPNEMYSASNPLNAPRMVGWLPIIQILLFIAACEAQSVRKVYEESCEKPGNYGFDPFGFSRDDNKRKFYELAEIKNGRLAMVAIGGAIHHALLTNVGLVEQIQKGQWCKFQAIFYYYVPDNLIFGDLLTSFFFFSLFFYFFNALFQLEVIMSTKVRESPLY